MQRWLLLTVFAFCIFGIGAQVYCPPNAFQLADENVCFFAVSQANYYHDVVKECSKRGGIPAKIQNGFENSYLFNFIANYFGDRSPYIGVERKPDGNWTYADGTLLSYQHWENPPTNTSICTIMNSVNGQWTAVDCSQARPSFCTAIGNVGYCPSGWVYFAETKSCYYLENFAYPDDQHWAMYNFSQAETLCEEKHGALVSIHSQIENNFVLDLIGTNISSSNLLSFLPPPGRDLCGAKWTWIGLIGTGVVGEGFWTDQTPVDWTPFTQPFVSEDQSWVIGNDPSCAEIEWAPSYYTSYARFMCKMPAKGLTKGLTKVFQINKK